jgi:hypothetical protein
VIRLITNPYELIFLAAACGLQGHFDDGTSYLDSANALGWGDPLRGVFLFKPIDLYSVEGHALVHPRHRGGEAVQAGRECLAKIRSLGMSVVAPAPRNRRDVRLFTRQVGMVWAGETDQSVFMYHGRN